VIAEGVETTEHGLMLILILMGCEEAQGYGIARPLPATDFAEWLSNYTPNQEWLTCSAKIRTDKETKIKLFRLVAEHWKNRFISYIQSSPEDNQHCAPSCLKNVAIVDSGSNEHAKRDYLDGVI